MIKDIKAAIKISLISIALMAFGYVCWIGGMRHMHNTITDDMKRYNEPAIIALTKTDKIYIYSQNMTFAQWQQTQKEEQ